MDTAVSRPELLLVADAVAREKSIEREEVIEAMEQAIQKAGRAKYGSEKDIRATIDRKTGDVRLSRWTEAVEVVENEETQIPVHIARKFQPDIVVGGHLVDPLPPIDFGRIAAQTAKQVIVQRVREYERKKQYDEFKDRIGEIVNGLVKRTEYGNLMVELGRAEALLRRDELIPRESFRNGDRVRAYIYDVREEPRGPQIFLSRTHPAFLAKLFAQEVPEIYDGIIEIKAVSRDPGSRAKMAVISRDSSIDPVGACVGMRGSRVQAVVQELQGEKIDIIPWSSQAPTFVVNALAPAEVTKVVMDEEAGRVEVVVPDEQLSLAIGRRGQNVRLASQLTRWDIDILTEAEESERRQEEYRRRTSIFVDALDVDDMIAGLLVTEGLHLDRGAGLHAARRTGRHRGLRRERGRRVDQPCGHVLAAAGRRAGRETPRLGRERRGCGRGRADPGDAGAAWRERCQDAGRPRRPRRRRAGGDRGGRTRWTRKPRTQSSCPPERIGSKAKHLRNRRRSTAERDLLQEEDERGPLRRCLVTREQGERDRMLRFVLGPSRIVVPDLRAKLPGRGMWLSPRADVIEAAAKKGVFARAARGPVTLPPDLLSLVREELTRRVIDLLGLARRAGQAVAGFEKARETVVRGTAGLIMQASDGSADEARRLLSGAPGLSVVRPLSAERLATAFGRDHVVHVAVLPGRLAERLQTESARLAGLNGGPAAQEDQDKRRQAGAAMSDRTER